MWPLGVKPNAPWRRIAGPFVSSTDEKTRGVGEMASTDRIISRAMLRRRYFSCTATRTMNVHWNQSVR